MSLQEIKADYIQEQLVLQTWKNRMDISGPTSGMPPENAMSIEYKQGWKKYLDAVLSISSRMIAECEKAEQPGGTTAALKALLTKEANAYAWLADEAAKKDLPELVIMLSHEAESRLAIANEL